MTGGLLRKIGLGDGRGSPFYEVMSLWRKVDVRLCASFRASDKASE